MVPSPTICLHLDKRRIKKNGTFPVKLRLYISRLRIQKYYPTGVSLEESQFERLVHAVDLTEREEQLQLRLMQMERHAQFLADQYRPFDLKKFEERLKNKDNHADNLRQMFEHKIVELRQSGQMSSAQSYTYTLKSILLYYRNETSADVDITVYNITTEWLRGYSNYMQDVIGNSKSTIGIYLRNLRHILNRAVESGDLDRQLYPFGKGKFTMNPVNKVPGSLSQKQIEALCNARDLSPVQARARDFWLFSYRCKGASMKDIALLKYEHIRADVIFFKGSKMDTVYLTDKIQAIIQKHGNIHQFPGNYVFPILSVLDNEEEKYMKIKRFTRFVNQHIKKLAKNFDLPHELSTNWARKSVVANAAL